MAWRSAQAELARWRESSDPERAVAETQLRVRAQLRAVFGLPADATLVLCPSGTDAIYLMSALMLGESEDVHHVVVGASELGGGTLGAARGLTFSEIAPFGSGEVGQSVQGLGGRCTAEPVYLRHDHGERKEPAEVDADVTERALAAADAGMRVVVHLVAHSKTGLRAPSVMAARLLAEELQGRGVIMVDAAQGRIGLRDVRHARDLGFPLLFTGSKFYSGPPFSGALVLPEALSQDPGPLPVGLAHWFSQADLPREWTGAHTGLAAVNPGLALRWVAALAEIESYHAIPQRERARVYHTFAGAVLETFGPSTRLEIDVPMPPVHQLVTGLGAFPTVFGFRVRDDDGWLDAAALRKLHIALDTDMGDVDPELAGRFHLGQPVALGPPRADAPAVLRVALGAKLIRELATSSDAGAAWLRQTLDRVRRKTEALVLRGAHR